MALCQIQRRYSKFILNACKNSSKFGLPTNRIQQSDLHTFPSSISHPISRNRECENQGRFYFKYRASHDYDEGYCFHNSNSVGFTLFFFTCAAAFAVSYGDWVTVPYTGRSRFILFYKFLKMAQEEHRTYEGKPLPPHHPDSITARRIFQDIIHQALKEYEYQYQDKPNCEIIILDRIQDRINLAGSGRFGKIYVTSELVQYFKNHEEMLATVFGYQVGHDLARHNEELFSKSISSVSCIGISFYLFSKSAYIRSKMPYFDKFMRLRFIPSFSLVTTVSMLCGVLFKMYHRKMEIEADRIGLMLAASAGYNPEVGVLYPVHGDEDEHNQTVLPEWLSAFPSNRTRNRYLSQPQVLNEAIFRYRHSLKSSTGTTDSTQA